MAEFLNHSNYNVKPKLEQKRVLAKKKEKNGLSLTCGWKSCDAAWQARVETSVPELARSNTGGNFEWQK